MMGAKPSSGTKQDKRIAGNAGHKKTRNRGPNSPSAGKPGPKKSRSK